MTFLRLITVVKYNCVVHWLFVKKVNILLYSLGIHRLYVTAWPYYV